MRVPYPNSRFQCVYFVLFLEHRLSETLLGFELGFTLFSVFEDANLCILFCALKIHLFLEHKCGHVSEGESTGITSVFEVHEVNLAASHSRTLVS